LERSVGLEQDVRLLGFHVPSTQFGSEFDQSQIACEAAIEAAKTLEEHDANRPGAKAAFSVEPVCSRVTLDRVEPFRVKRREDAYES
jgi:hypothetical protein